MRFQIVLLLCLVSQIFARTANAPVDADRAMHRHPGNDLRAANAANPENSAEYWRRGALEAVEGRLGTPRGRENVAKNVILFLGDGMSVPTLAATRMYMGGEAAQLSFDKFPHTAISKTYCVNYQVADSACSATAYLGGVKANLGTIGVTGSVPWRDCRAMNDSTHHVQSIAHFSQLKGKSTGVVTTARVTHASPAGAYAHTAERDWESDADVRGDQEDPGQCPDIAAQLVRAAPGRELNVVLGGGRAKFLPNTTRDEEGAMGERLDGANLIEEWKAAKGGVGARYVWNRSGLLAVDAATTDHLLGLFEPGHCQYNMERNMQTDPSLEEMTEAAIKVLSKNDKGFFLFVEGGKIDMAHHLNYAQQALDETVEFSKAVQKAVDITNPDETLIVVTSDHAHTLSYSGYALRGNDILGVVEEAADGLPYTTLTYANGKGFDIEKTGHRHDVTKDNRKDVHYRFPAAVPLKSETHGGDDVIIFAKGPQSHLFRGVMEQNVIPYLMSYASCVGNDRTACDDSSDNNNSSGASANIASALFISFVVALLIY